MRDYGSGSISKRKDGRFFVRLRIFDENGKPQQKGLGYTDTRREATKLCLNPAGQIDWLPPATSSSKVKVALRVP